MKTLFRADSSAQIGLGHINRCLIFAAEFTHASFACLNLAPGAKINYPLHKLSSNSPTELAKLIIEQGFERVVFDNYDIDAEFERFIKGETGAEIISFDDEIKEHFCDELIIPNLFTSPLAYENLTPRGCKITNKLFVRAEFYAEARREREKIYDFLICLGGSDPQNFSPKLAKSLPNGAKIAIATTSANPNLADLSEFARLGGISLFVDCENLARLMNQSAHLLISASSLVNEASVLSAKFTAYKTAQNQARIYDFLKNHGADCYDLA